MVTFGCCWYGGIPLFYLCEFHLLWDLQCQPAKRQVGTQRAVKPPNSFHGCAHLNPTDFCFIPIFVATTNPTDSGQWKIHPRVKFEPPHTKLSAAWKKNRLLRLNHGCPDCAQLLTSKRQQSFWYWSSLSDYPKESKSKDTPICMFWELEIFPNLGR